MASTLNDGTRLVALVGPSGSGKSSAVSAGLLPVVQGEWDVVAISPDQAGMETLESLPTGGSRRYVVVIDQFENCSPPMTNACQNSSWTS